MEKQPCVYLLASKRNGTLYTGVTSNLLKRVWEHQNNLVEGFTSKYSVHTLVWYEMHDTMESAIQREKLIKNRKRAWKIKTIEELNPRWGDLYPDLIWREVPFAAKQTLDNRVEHLDSGMRRNDETREGYPQIFLKSHKLRFFPNMPNTVTRMERN
jgi:putative endonuclease